VTVHRAKRVMSAPSDPPPVGTDRLAAGHARGEAILVHVVLQLPGLNPRADSRHAPRVGADGVPRDVLKVLQVVCPDAERSKASGPAVEVVARIPESQSMLIQALRAMRPRQTYLITNRRCLFRAKFTAS
jgi:hypothetical protein